MNSNDSNCPFCPGEASVPADVTSDKENGTCEFPQHPPAMTEHPHVRFMSAICAGDLETVKSLLDLYGLSHMEKRLPRCNFVCESLFNEKKEIAKLLLERGAEIISARKDVIVPPLHLAAEKGYTDVVSMLLGKGAFVNAKTYFNETALHRAVMEGKLEIVELLLNKMADTEVQSSADGKTPLQLAVSLLETETSSDIVEKKEKKNFGHLLSSRCRLCASSLEIQKDTTNATIPDITSREEIVLLLLDRGADVDALNWDQYTVLGVAIEVTCNFRIIERILHSRPDIKLNEAYFYHAVVAAGVEYRGIVELLVDYGFTLDRRSARNRELVHNAVRNGYTRIVDDLLMQGADIEMAHEIVNNGTLLHSAAASGRMTIAKLLVERGADVNAKDTNGKTPILYAVENMDIDMTRLFLTNGADDRCRPGLLYTAAKQGCSHIVEMILKHCPSIDVNAIEYDAPTRLCLHKNYSINDGSNCMGSRAEDKWDVTSLHVAAAGGFARVVELLLEHNANIDSFAKWAGSPLHCSVLQRNGAIVDMLLVKGAEVDADRGDGSTPLHLAVTEGNVTAFELLIKHGADVHKKHNSGMNLVDIALRGHHLNIFEEDLLDVFMTSHFRTGYRHETALHVAVNNRKLSDVEILLEHGADASVGDKCGSTPLHAAAFDCIGGEVHVLEALLNSLDDINFRDNDGRIALHEATQELHAEAVNLLLLYGSDVNVEDNLGNTPLAVIDKERQAGESGFEDSVNLISMMFQEHIVKMMALGLDVNDKNTRFIHVSSLHKDLYDKCNHEIQSMKITKIGESEISFYEYLMASKNKQAFYSRNPDIAEALNCGDHENTFKSYGGTIGCRFRKTKMINDLIDSSARCLSVLSGYSLTDDDSMEIVHYLDLIDLKNLTIAGTSDGKLKKKKNR